MITIRDRDKSIIVSLLLHILILIILAWSYITPMLSQAWYEFDYNSLEPLQESNVPALVTGNSVRTENIPASQTSHSKDMISKEPASSIIAERTPNNTQTKPAEILATPTSSSSVPQNRKYKQSKNPYVYSALRGLIGQQTTQNSTLGIEVKGGRLRFDLPSGYKHTMGESGSVTLQFKVDQFARPIANSIESIEQTDVTFYSAAKKVLMDGTLSFTGAPEPGVTYRITIEFL